MHSGLTSECDAMTSCCRWGSLCAVTTANTCTKLSVRVADDTTEPVVIMDCKSNAHAVNCQQVLRIAQARRPTIGDG